MPSATGCVDFTVIVKPHVQAPTPGVTRAAGRMVVERLDITGETRKKNRACETRAEVGG